MTHSANIIITRAHHVTSRVVAINSNFSCASRAREAARYPTPTPSDGGSGVGHTAHTVGTRTQDTIN